MNNTPLFDKKFNNSVVFNYIFRVSGILLGLLLTRINLQYLGATLFGLWSTIASIASWINYGDFGIGNGLRNELAKAYAENDVKKQHKLIATAAILLMLVGIAVLSVLIALTEVLFITSVMDSSLRTPMYITNAFFCLDFVLGIGRSIAYGYQKSWLTSLAQTGTVGFRIVGVMILIAIKNVPDLTVFSVVNGLGGLLGNVLLIFVLLCGTCKGISLRFHKNFDKQLTRKIFKLGVGFFLIQLSCIVLYSSDNLIINYLYSGEAVTKYSIITSIYNTGESLFSIVLINLWSAVTFMTAQLNYNWIKQKLKKLLMLWSLFSLGVIAVSVGFNFIVKIWLGNEAIQYEWSLIALFGFYTIASTFGSIFVNIANGLGRIKLQMVLSTAEAIINIPLSIFFAKTCGMGILGVKLATLCCCFGAIVVIPIDITMLLIKMKDGLEYKENKMKKYEHYYSVAIRKRESEEDFFWLKNDFCFKEIKIDTKGHYWYADPFIMDYEDKTYIFFEAFDLYARKGKIGYCVLEDDTTDKLILQPKFVIESDYHMSFPYLFTQNNSVYMIPETSNDYSIKLYKATEFPNKWQEADTLVKDIYSCDSVILEEENCSYLLTSKMYKKIYNDKVPSCWVKNILFRYGVDFEEEDGVKVATGDYGIRNAGKPFAYNNSIIRPGQDCRDGKYGKGLVLFDIESIDPYCEKEIYSIDNTEMQDHIVWADGKLKKIESVHTYNFNKGYEIIDLSYNVVPSVKIRTVRFFKRIKRFLGKIF